MDMPAYVIHMRAYFVCEKPRGNHQINHFLSENIGEIYLKMES